MSAIDFEVLRVITEHGGRLSYQALADNFGFAADYMNAVCRSLSNAGYIDFTDSEVCLLTSKGREELVRKGWLTEKQLVEVGIKSPPELKVQIKKRPDELFARRIKEEARDSSTPKSQIKKSPDELFLRRANMRKEAKGLSSPQAENSGEDLSLKKLELETLVALSERGGKTAGRILAGKVGHSYEYMDHVYRSLGRADYIDYLGSGVCVLTPKGRELVSKQKGEIEEISQKAKVEREKGMILKLAQLMARDGIFRNHQERWDIGGVTCLVREIAGGWKVCILALEMSQFIERWGWDELLGVYLAELDSGLSLKSYSRIVPEELEDFNQIEKFLKERR